MKKRYSLFRYFAKNVSIVVALVLIWRGIWYTLDGVDYLFFEGDHIVLALVGIIVGLSILYFPDKDLKEIEKL